MRRVSEPSLLWHAYPLGLLGADQTGVDRTCRHPLSELADWLPHLARLECDTLLLGPIFSSLSHGYDTVSHLEVDDRLGRLADLDALVAAADTAGIGVVLDGAFAYTSRRFRRLDEPDEAVHPWFLRDGSGALIPWRVDSLITPDHGAAGYRAYVADVLSYWLDRGVRGWRLDSAWSVPNAFWRQVLTRVREKHPTAWFLGQVFDDDLPPVINGATYSSATEYALMHGTREWLTGGSADRMIATLELHRSNSTRNPVHTFLGNHDFARLADVLPSEVLPLAFAVLATVPGVPGIYYGDEIALTSDRARRGSDALLRPPLAPTDIGHAAAVGRELLTTVRRLSGFRRAHPWLTSARLSGITGCGGALTYEVRDDDHAVAVHLNPLPEPVPLAAPPHHQLILGSATDDDRGSAIPPRSWAIYGSDPGS